MSFDDTIKGIGIGWEDPEADTKGQRLLGKRLQELLLQAGRLNVNLLQFFAAGVPLGESLPQCGL